jgi:hypothetical protein
MDPKAPARLFVLDLAHIIRQLNSLFLFLPLLCFYTTISFFSFLLPLPSYHRRLTITMAAMIREASNAADGYVPTAIAKRKASGGDGGVPMAMAKRKANDTNTPLQLTRKNLALLNSLHGDNNNGNNDNGNSYFESSDTMTTSTISSGFQQRAYENGILDPTASKPPQDLGIIQHDLGRRRSSTQPSEYAHQGYCKGISNSFNKARVSSFVQSKIMKDYSESDWDYGRACGRAITRIPKQDFNDGLSNPLPNIL